MQLRALVLSVSLGILAGWSCVGPKQAPSSAQAVPFVPGEPAEDGFDWIQLTSGEWLKGELLDIRDDALEFDSDELDELDFDWEDISVVRTAGVHTVNLERGRNLTGTLLIKDGKIHVEGPRGGTVDRKLLLAVVPGDGSRRGVWTGKLSASLTNQSGNTKQTDFSSYFFARRLSAEVRWDTTYNGTFSESDGVESANNNRLSSSYDFFLTRRLFVTPLAVTAFQDRFSNIDLRLTPSARIGYDLFDARNFSWEVGGGPAYEYTKYDSVPAGDPIEARTFAMALNSQIEWDITKDVELRLVYETTIPIPDTHQSSHHWSTLLSLEVMDWLDVDLAFIWDRINNPLTDSEGVTPESNDYKVSIGFGINF